jgi:hypothetical protein
MSWLAVRVGASRSTAPAYSGESVFDVGNAEEEQPLRMDPRRPSGVRHAADGLPGFVPSERLMATLLRPQVHDLHRGPPKQRRIQCERAFVVVAVVQVPCNASAAWRHPFGAHSHNCTEWVAHHRAGRTVESALRRPQLLPSERHDPGRSRPDIAYADMAQPVSRGAHRRGALRQSRDRNVAVPELRAKDVRIERERGIHVGRSELVPKKPACWHFTDTFARPRREMRTREAPRSGGRLRISDGLSVYAAPR